MSAAEELTPAPGNVIPLRWTARGFVRVGVVFTVAGSTITVSGPAERKDIYAALVAEVQRRVDVFSKFEPLDSWRAFPRVALPGVRPARSAACDACGDGLDEGRGGMCALCTIALQKVLRAKGRLP